MNAPRGYDWKTAGSSNVRFDIQNNIKYVIICLAGNINK